MSKFINGPTLQEIENFHTDVPPSELPKVEFRQDFNLPSFAQKGTSEALEDKGACDCANKGKGETEKANCFGDIGDFDDLCPECEDRLACQDEYAYRMELNKQLLDSLAEPDPEWHPDLSDEQVERLIDEIKKPITDEEIWEGIEQDIQELRERAIRRAVTQIRAKLLLMLESEEVMG
ncbi:hypothetical protein [Desulfosporosinus sp. SB140]|uniref:hypothetical protein n=1 Tax=Desulfosporosinus paludis TaxID=3115649 RepID=UPI00388F5A17